ncbi:MAG: flagellar filament capping protein FliD [Lachnospiraceae bacterium]|jgi:flagellar hook-associated protein 2|nr:flagellar filament capping protein FliD [Lachnospiraceae bacterium]
MTIRITGMNSGLDTEAIISELASARSVKVQKIQKDQTKLSWKIDAWKELNTKIYSLYSDVISDMRFDYAYTKKTTKVSDSDAVTVVTGGDAMNGVQSLKIKELAKTAYLTGAKIDATSGEKTLANLGVGAPGEEIRFKIKVGGEEKELKFNTYQNLNDVVEGIKELGLNAKFDEKAGRLYISSKESGKENGFELSPIDGDEKSKNALKALGLYYDPDDPLMENGKVEGQATMIYGQDSIIELNGAEYTSSTNTFEINGLTLSVHKKTGDDEISLTTELDTSGIYDVIKNFFTKYNELINEMDKLYNAESASKYEPLTKEEKDALSETEVEEWEKKIKESLLRRDGTLSSVSSALKEVMLQTHIPGREGINDGKDIYLSAFGIETLGYFKAKDNEKNAYHINGDPDDSDVKNYEDKLKKAIATDTDTVVEFFKELANNLYTTLEDKMARSDYSSPYTVYNDRQMALELKEYDSKVATEQKKLNDYIDRWYAKFSQMEVALSKINSQQSSISSLFG